jgi:sulfite exporter TauE/SafE
VSAVLVASALLMGLFGGAHCVTMCGGVVGVLSAGIPPCARGRTIATMRYALGYNVGRVASYAIAGAVAGGIGAIATEIAPVHAAQVALRIAAALLMLVVGASLAGFGKRVFDVEKIGAPLWRRIAPLAHRLLPVATFGGAVRLGLLWGWMPCGLVYTALTLALGSGSPLGGAATMLAFGIGTAPTLLTMGALSGAIAKHMRRAWARRSAGLAIAAFGVFHLWALSANAGWLGAPASAHEGHACCGTIHERR